MNELITDLLRQIILRLDTRTVSRLAHCNKKWHKTINNDLIWKALLARDFKEIPFRDESAKQSYIEYCQMPVLWEFSVYEKYPQKPWKYLGWKSGIYDKYAQSCDKEN